MTGTGRLTRRIVALSAVIALAAGGCARARDDGITLRFWAMGREGEVVSELARDSGKVDTGEDRPVREVFAALRALAEYSGSGSA